MRRIEHLIRMIRRHSDNEQLGADTGLSDEEIIQFLNDAQDDIYGDIVRTFRKTFSYSSKFNSVTSQEEYSLPTDCFLQGVVRLEYSSTGQEKDYFPLRRTELVEQASITGVPCAYMIRAGKIIVNPIPMSGVTNGFRIVYNKAISRLDKRRTTVKAVTVNGFGVITALTLENTYTGWNVDHYLENDYLTGVGADGTVKCAGINYGSVAGTGVVTLGSAKTLASGETITAGDFVCLGSRATTNSELADFCERYLIAYGVWKMLKRDSSRDFPEQEREIAMQKQSILDSYGETFQDVDQIPVINTDYGEYL